MGKEVVAYIDNTTALSWFKKERVRCHGLDVAMRDVVEHRRRFGYVVLSAYVRSRLNKVADLLSRKPLRRITLPNGQSVKVMQRPCEGWLRSVFRRAASIRSNRCPPPTPASPPP